jgi:ArsR family transcriptional regulator
MNTAEVAKISKALADPTRLQIYEEIAARPDLYCGEIIEKYELSPGTVSHHLKILLEAGQIECRREGQFVHNRRKRCANSRKPSPAWREANRNHCEGPGREDSLLCDSR